ncbi:MAG TPA: TetR/AcrR family transcriptional regulator [Candidatus Limnocylindria bacterium]|nr:TetR/AcrR family transcriptional regulator [Candidatus Limnocylindria bacterium]
MVKPLSGVGADHRLGRRRKTRAAAREKAIRAAALRIFRQKGYHAASMQDIADAVGLYKGSLYYYVSSKEELLVQLFEGRAEQVLREIDAAASGSGIARERLRAMVRAYVIGVLRNLDSVHVYLREEQALPPPALRQVHRQQHDMRDHFERVIVEGMREGDFVRSDPKLAALALLGMCTWVHRWYRPRGRLGEAAIADDLAERAVRMLSA